MGKMQYVFNEVKHLFCAVFVLFIAIFSGNAFGAVCASGEYDDGGVCTLCEAGYVCDGTVRGLVMYGGYTSVGQTGVSRCPNGQTTLNVGATSIDYCVSCSNSDNVQSWTAPTSSYINIMNVCRINKCKDGYKHVEIIGGENLFDISQIPEKGDSEIISAGSIVRDGDIVIVSRTATNSAPGTGKTLQVLCPTCQIGKRYILNITATKENSKYIYMFKTGVTRGVWYNGYVLQLTQDILNARVHFYDNGTYGSEPNIISDIQIREYDDLCVSNTINVNWDADNGAESFTTQCAVDGDIVLPTPPEKRGYTFTGWKLITATE